MEFFEYFGLAQGLVSLFYPSTDSLERAVAIQKSILLSSVLVGLAIYVLFLVLGGLGLKKMAERAGIKHVWMGFVPFLNTWYAGKVAGEANFFGQKMKRAGLYAAIFEGIYCVIEFILLFSDYIMYRYPEEGTMLNPFTGDTMSTIEPNLSEMPAAFRWLFLGDFWFTIFGYLAWFVMIVMMCVLFIAFFRKYYARSPIMMMLLSTIIPFRGATIFAVRNNAPVDYGDFMRRRMEDAMRRSAPYGPGPYNNGPYQNGPYNNGPYNNGPYNNGPYGGSGAPYGTPEEPFGDFGGNNANGTDQTNGTNGTSGGNTPPKNDNPFSDF